MGFVLFFTFMSIYMLYFCFFILNKSTKDETWIKVIVFFTAVSISMLWGLLLGELLFNDVKAIDVYRNKTDLQITYKVVNNDTVQIDSTVVYKFDN